jgi:pyrroline-5-carboxylate reductase
MLCVKPQDMKNLLELNVKYINSNHLIVSIAAGIRLEKIEKAIV